jgi:hypothetical protein
VQQLLGPHNAEPIRFDLQQLSELPTLGTAGDGDTCAPHGHDVKRLLGNRLFVQLRSGKLPKTSELLQQVAETLESIQCRRARWGYERWPADVPLTGWRLRHKVGVRPGKESSATIELIDQLVAGRSPVSKWSEYH